MIPYWLHALSLIALFAGALSALILILDIMRRPQHMWIMNIVWPLTGLYAGPLGLWGYYRFGRTAKHHGRMKKPFYASVGIGATHCGAGCTLGDIISEWLAFSVPAVAVWFGYQSIFADKMYAVWVLDFIFAFVIGVAFQYFAIVPMRKLGPRKGIVASLKADTLSLTAWQIGMYGFMAFGRFYLFEHLLGAAVETNTPEFWFIMQLAMIAGFITSYPVNWWLIRTGIKEEM